MAVASSPITSDTTLYAKWILIPTYDITYENNGHGEAVEKTVGVAKLPSTLPILVEEEYIFVGWYIDSNFETLAVASSTITSDTTLYAKWTIISYTNISDIEKDRSYFVKGTVILVTTGGYIIEDTTGMTFVNASVIDYQKGDQVKVAGMTELSRGFIQFSTDSTITSFGSTEVTAKTPVVLDGLGINSWVTTNEFGKYITISGSYSKSANYYKLGVDGCSYSIGFYNPTEDLMATLTSLSAGYTFTVTGYLLGNTAGNGDFVYLAIESITNIIKPIEQSGEEIYYTGFEAEDGFTAPISGASWNYSSKSERLAGNSDNSFGIYNGDVKQIDDSNCVTFRNYANTKTTLLYTDIRYLVTKFKIKEATKITITARYSGNFGDVNIKLSYSADGTTWVEVGSQTIALTSAIYTFNVDSSGEYYYRVDIVPVLSSSDKTNQDIYVDNIGFYK